MKRMTIGISMVGLVFGVFVLAQTQTQRVEQELINLEKEWVDAVVKHDTASVEKLSRMMADELILTFDGSNSTKDQLLESVKSGETEILSWTIDEWKVGVYGDAAVVMARNTMKARSAGQEETYQNRFTDTWIKRDGRWQLVAAHNSTIAQK
jgi:ketosteroid isomerase-like protein